MRPLRLMYVTDPSSCRHDVVKVAMAAVEGGADSVQVRGAGSDRAMHDLALVLVRELGGRATVLVNDRFDLALAAGAGGVHLKDSGLAVARVRAAVVSEPAFRIGTSVHDAAGLALAAAGGASHATLGPLHAAHGRSGLGGDALRAMIEEARAAGGLPASVLLQGGVGPEDAALARSMQRPGETFGLAAVRHFQDAPTLDEVARRAAALVTALRTAQEP